MKTNSSSSFKAYLLVTFPSSVWSVLQTSRPRLLSSYSQSPLYKVTILRMEAPALKPAPDLHSARSTLLSWPSAWPDAVRSHILVYLAFKAPGTTLAVLISLEYSGHLLLLSFMRRGTLLRDSLGAAIPDCTVVGGSREHVSMCLVECRRVVRRC